MKGGKHSIEPCQQFDKSGNELLSKLVKRMIIARAFPHLDDTL